jgi:hypothetical protein
MHTNPATATSQAPPTSPIQFYSVEIMPLSDGRVSVGIGATICEAVDDEDFQLINMDVANARVDTIDEALAVIRQAVAPTLPN